MIRYYHNPRCSKSRQGLVLLEEKGIEAEIKEYLKEPMTQKEVLELISKLAIKPLDGMIRTKEARFKELELKGQFLSDKEWAKIIVENPVLLERPILVIDDQAKIGRPPTDFFEIL
jgi:arsenate reductase